MRRLLIAVIDRRLDGSQTGPAPTQVWLDP